MLYAGAHGQTEAQMASALGFTLPQDRLHPALNWLDLELSSRAEADPGEGGGQPFRLDVVNQVWAQIGFEFLPSYLDTLAVSYGAGLQLLDFQKHPEPSRIAINDWVADQTHQRIQDLLPEDSIGQDTRVVLTNAVYFSASWREPFDESRTRDASFQPLAGAPVMVPTMYHSGEMGAYAAGDGYMLAELPYVGDQVVMTFLVPDAGRFAEIEAGLTGAGLTSMLATLEPSGLDIALPRFKVEFDLSMIETLGALGMIDAFVASKADFSGIDGQPDLVVGAVQHKAFIKVDEKGTEAAAATGVALVPTAEPVVQEVQIDRPFLFFLRDRPTGAVLFIGRVTDPAAFR
jgi:serpin B